MNVMFYFFEGDFKINFNFIKSNLNFVHEVRNFTRNENLGIKRKDSVIRSEASYSRFVQVFCKFNV